MAEYWVGEWNTSLDGQVEAGTEYTLVTPRRTTFNYTGSDPNNVFHNRTNQSSQHTPATTFNNPSFWTQNAISNKVAVQLLDATTDEHGVVTVTRSHSGVSVGLFPGLPATQVMVFTGELTKNRPTPDRPSQWDTYHDPYIFDIPLTGEGWTFTCNRDIDDGWIVLLLED